MSAVTLSTPQRIFMGIALKAVGSVSRIADFKASGDPELLKASLSREGLMLGTVAGATYALEHASGALHFLTKSPALKPYASLVQFLPLMGAYALAEGVSRHFSGLAKQLKKSTADEPVHVVKAENAGTINLFLENLNGEDSTAKGRAPVKVAELQFASQPNMASFNTARTNYSYPVSNPFGQAYQRPQNVFNWASH